MLDRVQLIPADSSHGDGSVREHVNAEGCVVVSLDCFSGELVLPLGITLADPVSPNTASERSSVCSYSPKHSDIQSQSPSSLALRNKKEKGPEPRWGATLTTISPSKAILYGGTGGDEDNEELISEVMVLSTGKSTWASQSGCNGKPLAWHTATFLPSSGHVLVFGGLSEEGESDEALVFDCDISLWYPLTTSGPAPTPRMGHSACLLGTTLLVYGGKSGRRDLNDLYALDTLTWRWSRPVVQGKGPRARAFHQAVPLGNNCMVVIGGRAGEEAFDDVHLLTMALKEGLEVFEWKKLMVTGAYFRPRCGHVAVKLDVDGEERILVAGGWNPKVKRGQVIYRDAFLLDIENAHWEDASARFPGIRELGPVSGHCAVALSDELFVFGGQVALEDDGSPMFSSELFQMNLTGDNKYTDIDARRMGNEARPSSPERDEPKVLLSTETPPRDDLRMAKVSPASKRRKLRREGRTEPSTRKGAMEFESSAVPILDLDQYC
mmetsp:Transcript_3138/g.5277  ORF Transcript_3138/g.5277 Transcript_3138/m.5277 type:complete len:494 (+) Transcript_3138:262-1743(+)